MEKKTMENCIFCDWEAIKEDTLYETDHFSVKVGFGIVAPGHVMIISKEHYACFSDLPEELWFEYQKLKQTIIRKITLKFAEPFLIEHGVWGQSVFHAHVHCIPKKSTEYEIKSIRKAMFDPHHFEIKQADLAALHDLYRQRGGYLMFEEDDMMFAIDAISLRNNQIVQNLSYRHFFTDLGVEGVSSWQNMSEENKIKDEEKREKTKKIFRKLTP